jgi:hypothetical protein
METFRIRMRVVAEVQAPSLEEAELRAEHEFFGCSLANARVKHVRQDRSYNEFHVRNRDVAVSGGDRASILAGLAGVIST